MKSKLLPFFLLLFCQSNYFAQNFYQRIYCEDSKSFSNSHFTTGDSAIYVTGYSRSNSTTLWDMLVKKIGDDGEQNWANEYGGSGTKDEGYDLLYFEDYIYSVGEKITGDTIIQSDFGIETTDVYLTKTDTNGNKVWEKTYDFSMFDAGHQILEDSGVFYIAASVMLYDSNPFSNNQTAVKLMKCDTSGQIEVISTFPIPINNQLYTIRLIKTYDDHLILMVRDEDGTVFRKINHEGEMIWEQSLEIFCDGIIQSSDGGFMVAGSDRSIVSGSNTQDIYLAKLTELCEIQWEKIYGSYEKEDFCYDLKETLDGNFVICGTSHDYEIANSFISKLNSNGEVLWSKEFGYSHSTYLNTISVLKGGYLATGTISKQGNPSVFLVKTDMNGDIDTSYFEAPLVDTTSNTAHLPKKDLNLHLYPNPSIGLINFSYSGNQKLKEVLVLSVSGKLITQKSIENNSGKLNISPINEDGVYFIIFKTDSNDLLSQKIRLNQKN